MEVYLFINKLNNLAIITLNFTNDVQISKSLFT